ncbi:MAG: hypothetical protein H6581_16885 [Bacteroidia bacterium]|nr:hypothetical protein [Bacteroidia bacterium]
MSDSSAYFRDLDDLRQHLQPKGRNAILLGYENQEDYPGMALASMLVIDLEKAIFQLDLQWMSLGLDLYGDTLQESYVYEFGDLESLLNFLDDRFAMEVTDIPRKYQFQSKDFPNPLDHAHQKDEFQAAWDRFREDFRSGKFLDPALRLAFDSTQE